MIVSHKHKFIFIKTRKTAGTSIEIALSKICSGNDIITPITVVDEKLRDSFGGVGAKNYKIPFRNYRPIDVFNMLINRKLISYVNHMHAKDIKHFVGDDVWNSYFKFTFDRNPYDKAVSLYYYLGGDKKYGNFKNFIQGEDLNYLDSFNMYSIDGQVAVDKVYKFEEMHDALIDINKQLHIDSISLPLKKAKGGTRKIDNYKDLFDSVSKNVIDVLLAREIKLLGYTY
jgi:hypothetical protein